jgi:hypothetical protein
MSLRGFQLLLRRASYFIFPAVFTISITAFSSSTALAQNEDSSRSSGSADFASSADLGSVSLSSPDAAGSGTGVALGAAAAAGGGQYDSSNSNKGILSHLTYEFGGGFNRPNANTRTYLTWGGNFGGGVGYRFNDRLRAFLDYQFIDDKLPGSVIAEVGAEGGHAHIWSLTANPEVDLLRKRANTPYLTGGFGFYRKVTSYTDPQEVEDGFGGVGEQNQVVAHFSSNQYGGSIGAGLRHRLSSDGNMSVFAEVRYLFVNTPSNPAYNVLGSTAIIPLTVGVRF